MSVVQLFCDLVIVFVLTVFLLNKYGDWRKQHALVTISTFIGWYFSFLIIFVLPLDVSNTFHHGCLLAANGMTNLSASNDSPSLSCIGKNEFIDNRILLSMWRIVYWTAQILTWIVLPLMQSYVRAGEFSTFGKLRSAVYNNLVYYGMYLIIFFFLMVYAAFKGVSLNAEHLKIILISASNTWGLFLLVVLLGYGLVEVPRHLLHMSNKGYLLSRVYFDIDCLSAEKNDAEDAVSDVYREANAVRELLRDNRLLSEHCDTIMSKFSPDVIESISSSHTSGSSLSFGDLDINYISNEAYLVNFPNIFLQSMHIVINIGRS
ncbi:hypothetical protein AB6A40_006800 [Gnathostoma spinigerum]|uniref:Uncharacterized protein n=1 Tax=Gnathostoma spinigerum TaxID=75299 RepID=A0ABD6EK05_9BILA